MSYSENDYSDNDIDYEPMESDNESFVSYENNGEISNEENEDITLAGGWKKNRWHLFR